MTTTSPTGDAAAEGGAPRRPGRQGRPTIRQVAALAGVSRATASRAINGGHLVSPAARKAVDAAIAELGFTPNPVARSLATRRTGSVALVMPEPNSRVLTDPFFSTVINGLTLALDESDLQVVLLVARAGASTDRAARYLTTGHVDGAVVASQHRDDSLNRVLRESDLPCVFIGRPFDPRAHHVDADNEAGGRLAGEHLVGIGRRRIGTVAGPADMTAGIDRLAGWRTAMHDAGLPDDAVEHGDFTAEGGAAAVNRLLEAHPDLDAIFIASDLMASGAIPEIRARGRSVPGDVAVVGFDDIGVAETTDPPLTTVAQPLGKMAHRAGLLIEALLADGDIGTEPTIFEARLTVRESA